MVAKQEMQRKQDKDDVEQFHHDANQYDILNCIYKETFYHNVHRVMTYPERMWIYFVIYVSQQTWSHNPYSLAASLMEKAASTDEETCTLRNISSFSSTTQTLSLCPEGAILMSVSKIDTSL